jgi:hypothetical protein
MNTMRSIGLVAAGVIAGAILVVSCSDDSPGAADAAMCDCPAAEPPLMGRIRQVTKEGQIGANTTDSLTVGCELGAQVIGGGCGGQAGAVPNDIVIRQSRPIDGDPGWSCDIRNNSLAPETVRVIAFCLVPATN